MSDDQAAPLRIRYEYKQDDSAELKYAHGVWGGINSQGEIEMNFYLESDALPRWSERTLEPDGEMGPEKYPQDERQKNIIRHIHTKLVLNYHTALAVQEWLEGHLAILEESEDFLENSDPRTGSNGPFEH